MAQDKAKIVLGSDWPSFEAYIRTKFSLEDADSVTVYLLDDGIKVGSQ
jgi:hypothetical protein